MLDLSRVPTDVFLATFQEQIWYLKELQRRLKANPSGEMWFQGDTRERVLLVLAAEYRRRLMSELGVQPSTELYEDWRPFLDNLDPDSLGPPRVAPEGWRHSLEEALPQMLTMWACAGFRTESLETVLRRFCEDNRDAIGSLTVDSMPGSQPTPAGAGQAFLLGLRDWIFSHSDDDYREIAWRGKKYNLTPKQAAIVKLLHEAHERENVGLTIAFILEAIESNNDTLRDIFRKSDNRELYGDGGLIVHTTKRRDLLRLNI